MTSSVVATDNSSHKKRLQNIEPEAILSDHFVSSIFLIFQSHEKEYVIFCVRLSSINKYSAKNLA